MKKRSLHFLMLVAVCLAFLVSAAAATNAAVGLAHARNTNTPPLTTGAAAKRPRSFGVIGSMTTPLPKKAMITA